MSLVSAYPGGLGESQADSIAVNDPFYSTGNVWFVSSSVGTDAAAPAGRNRNKPLATLAQAITNASSGDVIVLMDGHAETITALLTLSKRLKIVGGGRSGGVPTVTLTCNAAAAGIFDIDTAGCELRNILFAANSQANSASKVNIGARATLIGCHFNCGATDDAADVSIEAAVTSVSFRSCKWTSVATSRAAQPVAAVKAAGSVTDIEFVDCIVDDGVAGFSNFWAIDLSADTATDFRIENITLQNGADITVNSGSSGYAAGITSDGGTVLNMS